MYSGTRTQRSNCDAAVGAQAALHDIDAADSAVREDCLHCCLIDRLLQAQAVEIPCQPAATASQLKLQRRALLREYMRLWAKA